MLEFRDVAHLEQAWAAFHADPEVRSSFMAITAWDFSFLRKVSNYTMEPTSFSPGI